MKIYIHSKAFRRFLFITPMSRVPLIFVPHLIHPQSMPCMTSKRVALCAGCGRKIADRYYLLAVDKQWHMRCLKCSECKLHLESELTCFSKDGSIYCKEDYYRYEQRAGGRRKEKK